MKNLILSILLLGTSVSANCQFWTLGGNAVTGGQYIGTNNNQNFRITTNGTLRGYFNRNSEPFSAIAGNFGYGLRIVDPNASNGNLDLFTSGNSGGNETHIVFGPSGQISGQDIRFEFRSKITEGFYFNNQVGSGMYKFCTTDILHGFVGPNLFWRIGLQPTSDSNINGTRQLEVADNTVQFRLRQTNAAGANIGNFTDFHANGLGLNIVPLSGGNFRPVFIHRQAASINQMMLNVNGGIRARWVALDAASECIILGRVQDPANPNDVLLRRLDFTGNTNDVLLGNGTWGTPNTFGALCSDPAGAGDIAADTKVGLNDNALWFIDGATPTGPGINLFSIGYPCGSTVIAKFNVDNESEDYGGHFITRNVTALSGLAVGVMGESVSNVAVNVGVRGYAVGSSTANIGMISEANNTATVAVTNSGGRFSGDNASVSNFGIGASATGGSVTTLNRGVFGSASGPGTNYGIHGTATGGVTNYAGYFDGEVASTVGFTVISDEAIKENIETITGEDAAEIIENIHPVSFDFKVDEYPELQLTDASKFGMIAQEVEDVLPDVVMEFVHPAEYDSAGVEIHPTMTFKGLDYEQFIPILIANAKSQNEIINTQDSLITDLNERLTLLEDCLDGILPWLCSMSSSAIETMDEGTQEDLENSLNVTLSNGQNIILDQNVPNPFAERTTITYTLPDAVQQAQIMFYDVNGQLINTVDVQTRGKGQLNVYGADLSTGIYTYTLVADGKIVATKRMVKVD